MAIYLKGYVTECDFNGTKYDGFVEGAHLLVRGNSGRVCPIMYVGPEYIEDHGLEVVDYDTAVAKVEAMQDSFVGF
jgi:hypothetical protein